MNRCCSSSVTSGSAPPCITSSGQKICDWSGSNSRLSSTRFARTSSVPSKAKICSPAARSGGTEDIDALYGGDQKFSAAAEGLDIALVATPLDVVITVSRHLGG